MRDAARYGVARGCFSNEAGMGSAAITAAAATTDHPVRQAYINMTGTFWDTIVVCTITGLAIASSGVLGQIDPATGEMYIGSALTIAAFSTVLGKVGGYLVTIGIALSVILSFLAATSNRFVSSQGHLETGISATRKVVADKNRNKGLMTPKRISELITQDQRAFREYKDKGESDKIYGTHLVHPFPIFRRRHIM